METGWRATESIYLQWRSQLGRGPTTVVFSLKPLNKYGQCTYGIAVDQIPDFYYLSHSSCLKVVHIKILLVTVID